MAGTLNKVMLIGHLGEDVKTYYFDNGGCISRFSLATNDSYIDKTTKEKITTTEWHQIVVKNKLAEICEKHLNKGDKVYCEGKIKTRQLDQDGNKKPTTEIHVSEMTFLSPKSENTEKQKTNSTFKPGEIIDNLPF
ncbi:single-stranded DNA-binding protein [Flavobacteriaceae bacterium]|nr:single-stranded DNA-binding protein [Flavobacteriaceae bacterium]